MAALTMSVNESSNISETDHFTRFAVLLDSRSTALVVVEAGFLLLINLATLFGNLLLCAVLYKSFTFQSIITVLILALSITDILMGAVCMPLSVGVLIQGKWIYGDFACRLQCFFIYFLSFVSLQTMVLTSLNRFFRVVKPAQHNYIFTVKKTVAMLTALWISTALILTIPLLAGAANPTFNPAKAACVMFKEDSTKHKSSPAILIGLLLLVFAVIPTVVIFISYFKIFKVVGEHFTRVTPNLRRNEEQELRVNIRELRTARTLFAVVLMFVLSWLPVFTIEAVQAFGVDWWKMPREVQLMWTYFGSLSSAGNPLVYGFTNSSYRREYKRFLSLKWKKRDNKIVRIEGSRSHSVAMATINHPS